MYKKIIKNKNIRRYLKSQKTIWIIFLLLVLVGMYLRFWNIENVQGFGWDQARDSWVSRDILQGNFHIFGPRTGVGHVHLGPLYFYLLAPFYSLTNFDPMASNYFNIICNIVNFVLLFWVTKKLFGNISALFVILVYAFSSYLITINMVPWNVTLMPGVAAVIFYGIIQIYEEKYKWVFLLWLLNGFYFHLHFTAIFLPVISIVSLIFVKNKKKVLLYSLYSIPLYLVWFVPNVIGLFRTKGDEANLINNFYNNYFIGFHLRFFLHRLPYSLVLWDKILFFPIFAIAKYIIVGISAMVVFFEKDKRLRLYGYIMLIWIFIPWFCFSLYGGTLSEYYFLFQTPVVLFLLVYLQKKLLRKNFVAVGLVLTLFWSFYLVQNTKNFWVKPPYGGLHEQRDKAWDAYTKGQVLEYNEGDISSYFHQIWKDQKK